MGLSHQVCGTLLQQPEETNTIIILGCIFSPAQEYTSVDTLPICGDEMTVDRIPIGCLLFLGALPLSSAFPALVFL